MPEEGLLGRTYKDGETIIEEGTQSRTLYVVQSGKVRVLKNEAGTETTLATLGEGDIFGEMSLFDSGPRSATVRAEGDTRILAIDHEGLLKRIKMDPSLAFRIIEQMSRRIRTLNSRLSLALQISSKIHSDLLILKDIQQFNIKDLVTRLSSALGSVEQLEKELLRLRETINSRQ
jgi:CRP-like cAMP-binding protein